MSTRQQFRIDVVGGSISPADFKARYYDPEVPVLVQNAPLPVARNLTPAEVSDVCENEPDCQAAARWVTKYEFPQSHHVLDRMDISVPSIYEHCCPPADILGSRCRIWLNSSGATRIAPWHYDRGSIDVFCFTLQGRKKWTLVSPDSPLPLLAFLEQGLYDESDVEGELLADTIYARVETNPGDMLFIPRHWLHTVEHVGAEPTLQVDYVSTRKHSLVTTKLSQREYALEPIRNMLSSIFKLAGRDITNKYNDRAFTQSPSMSVLLYYFGKEALFMLTHLPQHVRRWRSLIRSTSAGPGAY